MFQAWMFALLLFWIPATGAAVARVSCGASSSSGINLCSIDPAIDSHAVCNDGTLPVFWFRPGTGKGADRWLIWLQPGGDCVDAASCILRAQQTPGSLTANGFQPGNPGGILSATNAQNPLRDDNTVLVHYCSSDNWSGNAASSSVFNPLAPTGWNFEGRRIALAAIASLAELPNNFAGAKRIVIGGSSAGGVGIIATANDILPLLPAGAEISIANDAGFTMEIGEFQAWTPAPSGHVYAGTPTAFDTHFLNGISLWQGRGDAICDAQAKTPLQHVQCYEASFVLQNGYIDPPVFVAEATLDLAQMTDEICPQICGTCTAPQSYSGAEGNYAASFAQHMEKSLRGSGTAAHYSVFSPDAPVHEILNQDSIFSTVYSFPDGQYSAAEALAAWIAAPRVRVVHIGHGPGLKAKER